MAGVNSYDHQNSEPHRRQRHQSDDRRPAPRQSSARRGDFFNDQQSHEDLSRGTLLDKILNLCREPPIVNDMKNIGHAENISLISPFKYDPSFPNREPMPIESAKGYADKWDTNHVRMPCSPKLTDKNRKPKWLKTAAALRALRARCNNGKATIADLQATIDKCTDHSYNIENLEAAINQMNPRTERAYFMTAVLGNICNLAIHVDTICSQPPPLLHSGKGKSVIMSQRQAASLLACAFFCLFPDRSEHDSIKEYEGFQNPNFNRLYQRGPPEKTEKLRCILHYFRRITENMPTGVVSFRRFTLREEDSPKWSRSTAPLSNMHATTEKKIEDVNCVLQVDFANKFIGGGVLGNGCVQEEIRFSLCPEMLVSLLVCEVMEPNECVFLIGCERYCNYDGYAGSFKFTGDYVDKALKDNWGRKWCHLVAMDAVFFRDREIQYEMNYVSRELTKAYTSFRPRPSTTGAENLFGIATGHWGCGVFNGDKQLKAIIQLMAASEAQRPLIYAAYRDRTFVNSFAEVYEFLTRQRATVGNLYHYLDWYSKERVREPLFEFIMRRPLDPSKL